MAETGLMFRVERASRIREFGMQVCTLEKIRRRAGARSLRIGITCPLTVISDVVLSRLSTAANESRYIQTRFLAILDADRICSGPMICPTPITYSIKLISSLDGSSKACFLFGIGFDFAIRANEEGVIDVPEYDAVVCVEAGKVGVESIVVVCVLVIACISVTFCIL